jgi:hypothetical protein
VLWGVKLPENAYPGEENNYQNAFPFAYLKAKKLGSIS